MKRLLFFAALSFIVVTAVAQKKTADVEISQILWYGEKVTGDHHGTIRLKSGWLSWQDNKITNGEFIVDMTTIEESSDTQKLESHLKSDDFFGVEKYPDAKLVLHGSTVFEKGTATIKGDLTIKAATHPIEFITTKQEKDGGIWFYSTITIDRTKYDVRYGSGKFFENLGDRTIF
ncbi:MAG TPA: YceI family protein [Bacteroidales bacterium]|nr:YceI family protein [Bacteroidales bacterium]